MLPFVGIKTTRAHRASGRAGVERRRAELRLAGPTHTAAGHQDATLVAFIIVAVERF